MSRRSHKYQFRYTLITLMIAFATIPLLLLAVPVGSYLFETTEASAKRELSLSARALADRLQVELRLLQKDSSALSLDSDIHRSVTSTLFVERSDVVLEDFIDRNPVARALFVYNLNGDFVTATPVQMNTITPPSKFVTDGLTFAKKLPRPNGAMVAITEDPKHLGLISPGAKRSPYLVTLTVPIVGLLDQVTGVILIQFGVDDLMTALPPRPDSSSQISLLQNKRVLWQSDKVQTHQHIISAPEFLFRNQKGPLATLALSIAEPLSVRFQPIRNWMLGLTAGATAIVLLLALIAWWLALKLTRAIPQLMELIRSYQKGVYDAPHPHLSFAEFSELGRTLEVMSGSILENIDAIKEQERLKGELYRTQIQFQIDTLKKQMSPHFLFNALNSVATLIPIDEARSQKMVGRLADLYRLILEASKSPTIPLQHELNIVAAYLELEQLRFGKRLSYTLSTDDAPKDLPFPGLLLQTLVENAVKHGIAKSRTGGTIELTIKPESHNFYTVQISNTGAPLKASTSGKDGTGTGLANTRERLTLLYGSEHGFVIHHEAGTTRVEFRISGQVRSSR